MSQSPTDGERDPNQSYLDAWDQLAQAIQEGQPFSGRERNCCFLNTRSGRFADVSSAIGLDHIDDSRAVAVVDWDHDGDLDLWVANRTGPRIRFLRNDMPQSGASIAIRLVGSPKLGSSRDAIGARVMITVTDEHWANVPKGANSVCRRRILNSVVQVDTRCCSQQANGYESSRALAWNEKS